MSDVFQMLIFVEVERNFKEINNSQMSHIRFNYIVISNSNEFNEQSASESVIASYKIKICSLYLTVFCVILMISNIKSVFDIDRSKEILFNSIELKRNQDSSKIMSDCANFYYSFYFFFHSNTTIQITNRSI